MTARINITRERLFEASISPFIYGEFVEFINDLIPGMWAERIRDRSFAGLSQPVHFYRKEKDFVRPAWRAIKAMNGPYGAKPTFDVAFDLDSERPFSGEQSARIRAGGSGEFLAGVAQDHVGVNRGEKLNIELYLRGEAVGGRVHVFIGREYGAYVDCYDRVVFEGVGRDWRRFEGVLCSAVTDPSACFAIALDGPGTLWIDKVSLMPADHRGGWRPDVVEAVKAAKPGIIRFGGSSLIYYDWRKGIGPREQRVPFVNIPWNNMEENDVGLDEFLHFCELVEARPLICVNSNANTPEDIARQVEYTNGSIDTEYGDMRRRNGHPEPYAVAYWQIGNEQRGADYERALPEYVTAMKRVDPSIHVMASYPSDHIINHLSSDMDFICPHFYGADMASFHRETEKLRVAIASGSCNPALKLGVTEWNHTAGDWGEARAWLQTLYNANFVARMFNHFQRNGDLIRIANRSNLVNSCYSGSIQTSTTDIYFTPAYHVQKLYATTSGPVSVRIASDSGDLDISGTMDADENRFMIWVVNPSATAVEGVLLLEEIGRAVSVRFLTLAGDYPSAVNSFENKDRVVVVEENVDPASLLRRIFPPCSVTGAEISFR